MREYNNRRKLVEIYKTPDGFVDFSRIPMSAVDVARHPAERIRWWIKEVRNAYNGAIGIQERRYWWRALRAVRDGLRLKESLDNSI